MVEGGRKGAAPDRAEHGKEIDTRLEIGRADQQKVPSGPKQGGV